MKLGISSLTGITILLILLAIILQFYWNNVYNKTDKSCDTIKDVLEKTMDQNYTSLSIQTLDLRVSCVQLASDVNVKVEIMKVSILILTLLAFLSIEVDKLKIKEKNS